MLAHLLIRSMSGISFGEYGMGVLIGIGLAVGFDSVLQGLEVLLFNGLMIEWTQQRALIAIGIGAVELVAILALHRWVASTRKVMEVEAQAQKQSNS